MRYAEAHVSPEISAGQQQCRFGIPPGTVDTGLSLVQMGATRLTLLSSARYHGDCPAVRSAA